MIRCTFGNRNGRWKSEWILTIPVGGNTGTVNGSMKVQVHKLIL